jgi:uncharacterized protein
VVTVQELKRPPVDFLAGQLEGYEFYQAFQDANIDRFKLGYLQARRNGVVVATAPFFSQRYPINTTLRRGLLKRLLKPFWVRIACIGNPVVDFGMIDGEVSTEVLEAFNAALARKAAIIAYKDFREDLPLSGFSIVPGLPVAILDIGRDFWAALKQNVRSDFRRRLRKGKSLRVEERDGFPAEYGDRLYELYINVHRHGEFAHETLNRRFFELAGPLSKYVLYWQGDVLIGFCLLMCKDDRMHYKYVGMDYDRGRPLGLYFFMSLTHIEMCLRDGYSIYQTGSTTYEFKQRLGSTLHTVSLFFRHRNPILNWILRKLMRIFSVKPEQLARMIGHAAASTSPHRLSPLRVEWRR